MKAEQRKKLQTNVLADSLGRLAQRVKTRPRRNTLLLILLAVAVGLGLLIFQQWRKATAAINSDLWSKLEDGQRKFIDDLKEKHASENAGKAARFQFAWFALWGHGAKMIGGDPKGAYRNLNLAKKLYTGLLEECQDDPVWEPEALYHLAAIEETLAAYEREHLKEAQKLYAGLAKHPKYQDSAYAHLAKERAKLLERDSREGKYDEIVRLYQDLQNRLKLQLPEPAADKK